jgi:hypothetical protein
MQVEWGTISMIDAEKRLLANALEDPDNQFFVLLSDRFGFLIMGYFFFKKKKKSFTILTPLFSFCHSCVPLYSFDYVFNYLMGTSISFVDW